jgi:ABC-type lipoprotein export system ATPase subunit
VIYDLLKEIAAERTVVVVTHAEPLARLAERIIHIRDGGLVSGDMSSAGFGESADRERTSHA